ncbi:hypothetical protein ILUMI_08498 [Ignelater luminosus]|uniref:N-acetyltransferase domain-containing protein n=1 Tax=Ignelater luminosus TaxID=2038154 RepID=A0A8K0D654_IGNLU|nr:hypothetical protein ILUMI_08498 [Ignelater luminosus]
MSRIWTISHNGFLKYVSLTPYHLQDALNIMRNCFFKEESVSRAIGLNKSPEAIRELDELVLDILEDGVSVIAVEEKTGKVAGSLLNKIITKEDSPDGYFKKFNFKHPLAKKYDEINVAIDNSLNGFELFKSNCYFESVYVTALPEFRNKEVALKLLQSSLKVAQCLKDGEDVRISVNSNELPPLIKPTGVLGIATTIASEKIMIKEEFVTGKVVDLKNTLTTVPLSPITIMYKFLK